MQNKDPVPEFSTLILKFTGSDGENRLEFILLPYNARTYWLVGTSVALEIVSGEVGITRVSGFRKNFYQFVGTKLQKGKYVYRHRFDVGPSFVAVGRRNRRSIVWQQFKALKRFGLLPNSGYFRGKTENTGPLPDTGSEVSAKCIKTATQNSIAVVLHLHYGDLWSEFSEKLMNFPQEFDLFITLTRANCLLENQIESQFPGVHIHIVENRGRDIGPFFHLIRSAKLSGYELICKIHGKKTLSNGVESPLGMFWRRKCLLDLLGSEHQINKILEMFKENSQLGMVGPDTLRLPNKNYDINKSWSNNKIMSLGLIDRLGVKVGDDDLDFFAGSMFWCRGDVVKLFERLDLADGDFTEEQHQLPDGRIEHALERVFGLLVKQSEMHLDSPPKYGLISPSSIRN